MLVHLPGRRLARHEFFDERPCANAGAQVGTVRPTMSPLLDRQRGAELHGPPEERAEDTHRALPAEVEPRRARFRHPAQDREPRLRRRAEEAVEERALLIGRLGQRQAPGLDPSVARDPEREAGLIGADLKPGDAADRLAGRIGAGRIRHRARLAEHDGRARAGRRAGTANRGDRPSTARQTARRVATTPRLERFGIRRRRVTAGTAVSRPGAPIRPPGARSRTEPGSRLRSRGRGGRRWSGPRSCQRSRDRGRSPGRRSSGRGRGT